MFKGSSGNVQLIHLYYQTENVIFIMRLKNILITSTTFIQYVLKHFLVNSKAHKWHCMNIYELHTKFLRYWCRMCTLHVYIVYGGLCMGDRRAVNKFKSLSNKLQNRARSHTESRVNCGPVLSFCQDPSISLITRAYNPTQSCLGLVQKQLQLQ